MIVINELMENGNIEARSLYSQMGTKQALICFLEQNLNNNFNTWDYDKSKFWSEIKVSPSKIGVMYEAPNKSVFYAMVAKDTLKPIALSA